MNNNRAKTRELLIYAQRDISNLKDVLKELMDFDSSLFDKKNAPYYIRNQWGKFGTTYEILDFLEEDIKKIRDFLHKQLFNITEESE